jgi:uncharacterized protein
MYMPSIRNKEFPLSMISIALTVIVTVASVIFTAKFVGPIPLTINSTVSQKQNLFTSSGESQIDTIPDQAEVSLGISVNKATVADAQDEANQVINSINEKLKKMGIDKEDIKTQNYSIYPEYGTSKRNLLRAVGEDDDFFIEDEPTSERKIIGYNVSANLRVKVTDFDKLNSVIDMAADEGANQVGGIQFSLSQDKEDELKEQARKEAIEDAKNNAKELAKLSGVKLGKVVDVNERTGGSSMMYAKTEMMAMDSQGGRAPTNLEPGSTTYEYSVSLSYETL